MRRIIDWQPSLDGVVVYHFQKKDKIRMSACPPLKSKSNRVKVNSSNWLPSLFEGWPHHNDHSSLEHLSVPNG